MLVALPSDGAIFEVEVAPGAWAREACRLAERALTRDEWSQYVSRELPYAPACGERRFRAGRAAD